MKLRIGRRRSRSFDLSTKDCEMKKFPAIAAVAAVAAGAAAIPATASTGVVRACSTTVYPNGPVIVTSARNLTCNAAAREQRRKKWTGANRFTTPGGFKCAPSGKGQIGYQIRCVRGAQAYRIEFSGG